MPILFVFFVACTCSCHVLPLHQQIQQQIMYCVSDRIGSEQNGYDRIVRLNGSFNLIYNLLSIFYQSLTDYKGEGPAGS